MRILKFGQNFDANLKFVDIFKPTNNTLPKAQETPELSNFAQIQCQLQVQSLQPDSKSSFFCICHFLSFAKVHHHYKDQNAQFSGDFNIIECSRVSKVSSQQLKTHSHSQYYKINSSWIPSDFQQQREAELKWIGPPTPLASASVTRSLLCVYNKHTQSFTNPELSSTNNAKS